MAVNCKPKLFCYIAPFLSLAMNKHTNRLIKCLLPNSELIYIARSKEMEIENVTKTSIILIDLPRVHWLIEIQPQIWSLILWIYRMYSGIIYSAMMVIFYHKQIDVVICFLGSYYTPIVIVAKLLGKKVIIYDPASEAVVLEKVYNKRMGWFLLKNVLRFMRLINRSLADIIVIESFSVVKQGNLGPYFKKLRQQNNYLDISLYRNYTSFSTRGLNVGFVGRLSVEKGILQLLDAANLLSESGIRLQVVGDGLLRPVVEERLSAQDMSHVSYLGWKENEELVRFLNTLRLCVLPTCCEGMPNTVLESMACGTPVLTTSVGGVPDVIQESETGFILPDTSPETIARSIVSALGNPDLETIALRGCEFVRGNFSARVAISRWSDIISELYPNTKR